MIHYNKKTDRFRILTIEESAAFFNNMYMTKLLTTKHSSKTKPFFEYVCDGQRTVYYDGASATGLDKLNSRDTYTAFKFLYNRLNEHPDNKLYVFFLRRMISGRLETVDISYLILKEHLPNVKIKIRQYKVQCLTEEPACKIENLFVHL